MKEYSSETMPLRSDLQDRGREKSMIQCEIRDLNNGPEWETVIETVLNLNSWTKGKNEKPLIA